MKRVRFAVIDELVLASSFVQGFGLFSEVS